MAFRGEQRTGAFRLRAIALSFWAATERSAQPAALRRSRLSGKPVLARTLARPCRCKLNWNPDRSGKSLSSSGRGQNLGQARDLARRFQNLEACREELEKVWAYLGTHVERRPRGNAGTGVKSAGQRLAALPDDFLPAVGAHGFLSIRRRVRFSRPASGFNGAGSCAAGVVARTIASRRRAPVPRRRRPALVASAARPRRAHAFFRRFFVAGLRNQPLCRNHRRHRRAG